MTSVKTCRECGTEKPLADFHRSKQARDGYLARCRECVNAKKREWAKNNREKINEWKRRWRRSSRSGAESASRWYYANKHKALAQRRLHRALARGALVRPSACDRCHRRGDVHGHHPDYDKPLEVDWLCPKCHRAVHAEEAQHAQEQVGEDR